MVNGDRCMVASAGAGGSHHSLFTDHYSLSPLRAPRPRGVLFFAEFGEDGGVEDEAEDFAVFFAVVEMRVGFELPDIDGAAVVELFLRQIRRSFKTKREKCSERMKSF